MSGLDKFIVPVGSMADGITKIASATKTEYAVGQFADIEDVGLIVQGKGLLKVLETFGKKKSDLVAGCEVFDQMSTVKMFVDRALKHTPPFTFCEAVGRYGETGEWKCANDGPVYVTPSAAACTRFLKSVHKALTFGGMSEDDIIWWLYSIAVEKCNSGQLGYAIEVGHVVYLMKHELKVAYVDICKWLFHALAIQPGVPWGHKGTWIVLTTDQYGHGMSRYAKWVRKRFDKASAIDTLKNIMFGEFENERRKLDLHQTMGSGAQDISVSLALI